MKRATIAFALALAGCATQQQPAINTPPPGPPPATLQETPASALVDHTGDSTDTAVTVPADVTDDGVRFENDWIYDQIGRFRRLRQGTGQLNGRRFDVIEVETPAHEQHKYFFDITDMWKKWHPQP